MNTRTLKPRYEVAIYDGQEVSVKTMTREQVAAIDPQSFDHYISHAFGIWGFRTVNRRHTDFQSDIRLCKYL